MSTDRAPRVHYGWIVLGAVTVILLATAGVRSSFGVFIKPMEAEFGWGRTSLSIAASLSLFISGAVGALVGRLADRRGDARRGQVLGIAGGGTAAGQLVIVPVAMTLTVCCAMDDPAQEPRAMSTASSRGSA